ncbi:MAG: hypothetical protein ABIP49_08380 [Lysobacterales bacterium]
MLRLIVTLVALGLYLMLGAPSAASKLPYFEAPGASARSAADGDYWVGPVASGSWYDPSRDGEGLVVEILPNGRALATWFTYPALGEIGDQAWLSAQNGVVSGDTIRFADVLRPRGGVFGAAFDPAQVVLERWGTMELRFVDCNTAVLTYSGSGAYGSGTRNLQRLTAIDELECGGARELTATGARALSGLRAKSGAWFVPSRSGEGWFVQELPNGNAAIYWFTFTPEGRQAFTVGVATRNANRLELAENQITRGTNFGDAFNPASVQRIAWGRLDFEFTGCGAATVSYASTLPGYGSGSRQSVRLTALAGAVCIDGTPVAKTRGSWRAEAAMPLPAQSEHAATTLASGTYIVGGFGDPRGFKLFDTVSNTWSELPDLPGGRDHLAAFALDDAVYASGGAAHPGGDQTSSGFRFDIATQQWQSIPSLPFNFGSHAAVLNGHGFIGSEDGSLTEFDATRQMSRTIAPPLFGVARDHSQVVAFLGEIWMMGGRFPETNSTVIYDPASGRWRSGPAMARVRGGFAAAVVDDQIVIGGGEVLSSQPFRVEPTLEVYTAGGSGWQFGPNLPVAVHGVAGAAVTGRFYAVGGSRTAGSASGQTGQTHSIQLEP